MVCWLFLHKKYIMSWIWMLLAIQSLYVVTILLLCILEAVLGCCIMITDGFSNVSCFMMKTSTMWTHSLQQRSLKSIPHRHCFLIFNLLPLSLPCWLPRLYTHCLLESSALFLWRCSRHSLLILWPAANSRTHTVLFCFASVFMPRHWSVKYSF